MFPDEGITKGDLAKGFWQKDVSKGFPEWLERVGIPHKDGIVNYPIVTDLQSLMWVTNQNTITHHVWISRVPDLNYPDLCVFDLDPSKDDVKSVRGAAVGLRDLLEKLGLRSWIKTTGGKGFHIVVPIDGKTPVGDVVRFADAVGTFFVSLAPGQLTQEFSKVDRRGRIYIDTGRNGYSATFAAAYTVRAKPGATVSAPCTWEEVERGKVSPDTFTVRNMPARIAKVGDLWKDLHKRGRSLKQPMEKLRELSVRKI
jgi:bifunctional non-homologous end joining protein LigD